MYNYILDRQVTSVLPKVAAKSVPSKRASMAGVSRYAGELRKAYPEQSVLIDDIAKAAKFADNRVTTKSLFNQLVDLERYLITTS